MKFPQPKPDISKASRIAILGELAYHRMRNLIAWDAKSYLSVDERKATRRCILSQCRAYRDFLAFHLWKEKIEAIRARHRRGKLPSP